MLAPTAVPHQNTPRVAGPVSQLMADLRAEKERNARLQEQVDDLKEQLAVSDQKVVALKDELLQQQRDNNSRMDVLLKILAPPSSSSVV